MFIQRHAVLLLLVMVFLMPLAPVRADETPVKLSAVLSAMEMHAENMVNAALAHDIIALQKIDRNIQQDLTILHNELEGKPFNERLSRELLMAYSWTRIISVDIRQHAWVGVAIASNQLSASMFQFTNYSSLRQRDIAWMGYLSRELLLLNMESPKLNAELLNIRRADLNSTWQRVSKELIKDFHNKPYVIKGNDFIGELKKINKPTQVISLAKKLLVFVDEIKSVQSLM